MKIISSLSLKYKIKIQKMNNNKTIKMTTKGNMNKGFIKQIIIQQVKYVTLIEILLKQL